MAIHRRGERGQSEGDHVVIKITSDGMRTKLFVDGAEVDVTSITVSQVAGDVIRVEWTTTKIGENVEIEVSQNERIGH